MNLILFGFKNCGKTTLGKRVAIELSLPFIDTDDLVETLHYSRRGTFMSCRDIVRTFGETFFRTLEKEVVSQLKNTSHAVIALGGGLILDPENAQALAKLGQLVYLKVNKQTLKNRTLNADLPSYLDPTDPEGSFEKMYQHRKAIYDTIVCLSIDLQMKTQDQITRELCALIQQQEGQYGQ